MQRSAVIDGPYRYRLDRRWAEGPTATFVLLNPSTADAERDDPTLRRCIGFARGWGLGGLTVVNLFALRATDPRALRSHADPVGPGNDAAIGTALAVAERVVLGWGNHGLLDGGARARAVWRRVHDPRCLGITARGQPRHPLYVAAFTGLAPAPAPADPRRA